MIESFYVLQGWDYYLYYLFVIYYKYIEFSLMIRACAILLTLCLVGFVIAALVMTYNNYVAAFKQHRIRKMQERYGKIIENIVLDEEILDNIEIRERLGLSQQNKKFKDSEREAISAMMTAMIENLGFANINRTNYEVLLDTFLLVEWIEHNIEKGSVRQKIEAFRMMQILDCRVRSSQSVQYVYDRNTDLKKAARYAYIYSAQSAPFRFFEEDPNFLFYNSDAPSIHYILEYRQKNNMSMPDYINWMKIPQPDNCLKLFCIKEIEFFDKREDCKRLYEIYKTETDNEVRGHILRTLGKFKYYEMENELMATYNEELEFVKRCIAVALMELGSGNPGVPHFLKEKYDESRDIKTTMTILNALYNCGAAGRALFEQLEAAAPKEKKMQFLHIKDTITNDRAYEL